MAQTPNSAAEVSEERAASKRVGVLQALLPYFAPYKIWVVLALAALTITASVSLILPVAARRVIDGFSVGDVSLLNQYFMGADVDLADGVPSPNQKLTLQMACHPLTRR